MVTGDALGCQKGIAAQVIAQGGDYLLALNLYCPVGQYTSQQTF
jgi:predicted transposase YbfD/YdcC